MKINTTKAVRLFEQAAASGLATFGGTLLTEPTWNRAALSAALAAGVRALYGVVAFHVGDPAEPSIK